MGPGRVWLYPICFPSARLVKSSCCWECWLLIHNLPCFLGISLGWKELPHTLAGGACCCDQFIRIKGHPVVLNQGTYGVECVPKPSMEEIKATPDLSPHLCSVLPNSFFCFTSLCDSSVNHLYLGHCLRDCFQGHQPKTLPLFISSSLISEPCVSCFITPLTKSSHRKQSTWSALSKIVLLVGINLVFWC